MLNNLITLNRGLIVFILPIIPLTALWNSAYIKGYEFILLFSIFIFLLVAVLLSKTNKIKSISKIDYINTFSLLVISTLFIFLSHSNGSTFNQGFHIFTLTPVFIIFSLKVYYAKKAT